MVYEYTIVKKYWAVIYIFWQKTEAWMRDKSEQHMINGHVAGP
jgi:hypothetical protein